MVGYLFAGQGAQYVGMGKDLYEAFAESKEIFDKADKILGFSLSRMCFEGPQEELAKTDNCQPAIFIVSIAALEAFTKSVKVLGHQSVGYVAGLSLGEYSALVAAGAISFEDGVYLVRRRGEFMQEEAKNNPGKMAAVLDLSREKIAGICRKTGVEIANINAPGQIVISGKRETIDKAKDLCIKEGAKKVVELGVSGAFHSSFMSGASLKLAKELEKIKINSPKLTVVSNVTAQPVSSAWEIKDNLIKQVASSVLWEDSMKFMLSQGLTRFFEFGPGKVLKGLMRRINGDVEVTNIEKKEDILSLIKTRS